MSGEGEATGRRGARAALPSNRMWALIGFVSTYSLFHVWYDGWFTKGRLTKEECESFAQDALSQGHSPEAVENLKRYLLEDDGKEFLMVNLLQVKSGEVAHPHTKQLVKASKMLDLYSTPFFKAMVPRAGHPVFFARAKGGYVDAWNVPPNPGWTNAAVVRYRSRRDLVAVINDPRCAFRDIHLFKELALASTFAFPSRPILYVGPRVWVFQTLALGFALLHIAFAK